MFVGLSLEESTKMFDFSTAKLLAQWDVKVWYSKVTVIFWDLVLQDEVISKGIPGQIREQAVVLVAILPVVGEDQIRFDLFLQLLKNFFDGRALEREKTVPEILNEYLRCAGPLQQGADACLCLAASWRRTTEDHPVNLQTWKLANQFQYGAAATNFDIIGMRAKAEDAVQLFCAQGKHVNARSK